MSAMHSTAHATCTTTLSAFQLQPCMQGCRAVQHGNKQDNWLIRCPASMHVFMHGGAAC